MDHDARKRHIVSTANAPTGHHAVAFRDLILDRPEVSRHHAELLRIDATSYELRDLGSTNGTLVNGVPIETALVTHGDEIRLGAVPFRILVS